MTGLELATIALRAFVYAGSIAVAGGALFRVSLPRAASMVAPTLKHQIVAGFAVLLLVEPLRYCVFQLTIADGDAGLAFGPELRSMAFQTPIGQAALVRLAAAIVVLGATLLRAYVSAAIAASVMIAAFLLEGHTAASDLRIWAAPLLALHLAAVHWWLGALFPLIAVTRLADPAAIALAIEAFGRQALWVVATLVAAGSILAVLLTGATVNLASPYQQRLLVKLALVIGLISIAALNKLRLTPMLRTNPVLGAQMLRTSIRIEILLAFSVLTATAWLTATAPDN